MEPNLDLLASIFGIETAEEWDDEFSNTHKRQAAEPAADERAADFEREVATADAAAIENDATPLGWKARMHARRVGYAAAALFGYADDEAAADAAQCDAACARRGDEFYRALQRIRRDEPALYALLIAHIAWRRQARPVDAGPLANDWGE